MLIQSLTRPTRSRRFRRVHIRQILMAKLILLDRDGVINLDSPDFIKSPEEWQAIPGSLEAIARFRQSGFQVAICSNQSGVARGLISAAMLDAIEDKMRSQLRGFGVDLDLVLYCTHHPDDGCACRKPEPGMLLSAMSQLKTTAADTCFVGDSLRDLHAATNAGCEPILVETGNGTKTLEQLPEQSSPRVFTDLLEFSVAELAPKS